MANTRKKLNKLTPMAIHDKEFKQRGHRGYDRQEVDEYLDKIVDDYGDTLDENVDLKNEIADLKNKVADLNASINDLTAQIAEYQAKQSENENIVVEAKTQAENILKNAHQQAQIDTDYEEQQQDVLRDDYGRLKEQVAEFRNGLQKMLQTEIDNLNDDDWQVALDDYFGTARYYPGDGSEPIPSADDAEVDDDDFEDFDGTDMAEIEENLDDELDEDDEDNAEVDNSTIDDVKSEQDDSPKPMTGDSSSSTQLDPNVTVSSPKKLEKNIVFPEDYKNHN